MADRIPTAGTTADALVDDAVGLEAGLDACAANVFGAWRALHART